MALPLSSRTVCCLPQIACRSWFYDKFIIFWIQIPKEGLFWDLNPGIETTYMELFSVKMPSPFLLALWILSIPQGGAEKSVLLYALV